VRHNAVVKAYLLYEVVEASPGHHCDLRDLVSGGEMFRVRERMGTQRTSSRAASQGQEPYDSRWMCDELKLGKYRNS